MGSFDRLAAPEVAALLQQRRFAALREALRELEPADVAEIVDALDDEQAAITFRLLPRDLATEVFAYLDGERQQALIETLSTERIADLLNELDPDDRTAFLEEMPAEVAQRLIALLNPTERRITLQILGYPEESVGRLMTPDYVRVRPEWTIARALDHIRKHGRDAETINVIYVVDEHGRLIDDLRIRQILLADPTHTVASIMDRNFVALRATDDREEAVRAMQRYDRVALPVVDSRGVLLGIVTADDVADVAEEEATEDIHKMAGMEALDAPYLESRIGQMVRKRGGWLAVLFFGQSLTAAAMAYFEAEIRRAVVLALFVPMIISSGGNSGSQATSLIIRAMAVGDVGLRDWLRVMVRELGTGILLGALLGLLAIVPAWIWSAGAPMPVDQRLLVSVAVASSVVGVVAWGSLVGSMLPFVLRALRLDPAMASAPLVSTICDVTGVTIYFTVAWLVLRGSLL